MIFVFEGVDGAGKSYIQSQAAANLKELGFRVAQFSDPSKEIDVTKAIRAELFRKEYTPKQASVMFKAARYVLEEHIKDALHYNDIILLDRYWPSTAVYQYSGLDNNKFHEVIDLITDAMPVKRYFHLLTDPDIIRQRLEDRVEDKNHYDAVSVRQIKARINRYTEVFELYTLLTKGETTTIDTSLTSSVDFVVSSILKDLGKFT